MPPPGQSADINALPPGELPGELPGARRSDHPPVAPDQRSSATALAAVDEAVQAISSVLAVEEVLQLIVDRVRDLVDASYAALGIADATGRMERFITSGLDPHERLAIGSLPEGRGLLGLIIREGRAYPDPVDRASTPTRPAFRPTIRR